MEYKTDVGYIRRGKESDQWLIEESKQDRWMACIASTLNHMHGFVVNGEAVGYVVPRPDADGFWHTGSVYLTPKVRTFHSIKTIAGNFFNHKKRLAFGVDRTHGVLV